MDEKVEAQDQSQMLMSIIRLLLSLANMADLASSYPRALCAVVLWILRPAEAAVSVYADLAPDILPAPLARSGNACIDAMRLARRLRILADAMMREAEFALLLEATATQRRTRRLLHRESWAARLSRALQGGDGRQIRRPFWAPEGFGLWALPPPDT